MALPTKLKTWEFDVNQRIAWTGSEQVAYDNAVLALKDTLKSSGLLTVNWLVESSCDGGGGNVENNNGVDRWNTASDIDHNNSGSTHSWIVLKNPAVNSGKFQVCIDCNFTSGLGGRFISWLLSPSAGFGAVNGGADGTLTNRPTATDQILLSNDPSGAWIFNDSGTDIILHVLQSDDGENTRWMFCRVGNVCNLTALGVPNNPLASASGVGWPEAAGGFMAAIQSSTTFGPRYGQMNDKANYKTAVDGTAVSAYLSALGDTSAAHGQNVPVVPDLDSVWEMTPMGIWALDTQIPGNGHLGEIKDAYWVSTGLSLGDLFPGAGSPPEGQWVVVGDIAIPWNDTTVFDRS